MGPWVWAVIAVVVAVAVALTAVAVYFVAQVAQPPSPLGFAPVEVQFSGPPCPGWSNESLPIQMAITGGPVTLGFGLMNRASGGSCTAEGVSIPTPGFTILSSNTPLTVTAGTQGGFNVTVLTPSTMPVGNVTMIIDVGAVTAGLAVSR